MEIFEFLHFFYTNSETEYASEQQECIQLFCKRLSNNLIMLSLTQFKLHSKLDMHNYKEGAKACTRQY
ncbi:hypothetical protein RIF29_15177 [Crotalaria pallida]|uniref:Uncharacterized protein n=1 Tax=Crotalaria pallida TaxID=3830 RepID=A0AAN9IAZ4_CROPI